MLKIAMSTRKPLRTRALKSGAGAIIALASAVSPAIAQSSNPITWMARQVNSDLAVMDDRLSWLEERTRTMAVFNEHLLRSDIGARGYRPAAGAPDPFVIIDLGAVHEIDRIFLVPAQRESLDDTGIFPRQFTLDAALEEDFAQVVSLFSTGRIEFPNPNGRPMPFPALKVPGRFIRLTVHRGVSNKGWLDLFGLSEIIVISNRDVVSFGAHVTMSTSLDSGQNWHPQALTDGRMPHGIWQSGVPSDDRGDEVIAMEDSATVSWEIVLAESHPIDRIVLFPIKLAESSESLAIANRVSVDVRGSNAAEWQQAAAWQNRPDSSSCVTPVILPVHGITASRIRIRGEKPWQLGDTSVYGLSEIEVWSGGENIARDLPVQRVEGNQRTELSVLTNGFTGQQMIANIDNWLEQLHDRVRFESELAELRPRIRTLQSESELNITFASAILLSLTFLIPVFLYEKRRTRASQRLESLRRRIAADLHDDVGGNLGSISLIARSTRRGLEKIEVSPDFTNDLHEVELIARESSLAMRDIVWLIEQRDDSVGDLVTRMRETGARMLREMDYSLSCRSDRTNSRLSLDFKRHFFLFFKEALHNILKHSQAEHVRILLEDDGDQLVLDIEDDGVGMPQEVADDPNTSRKLRQRAEVIGGDLSIISSAGNGTRIRLKIDSKKLTATFANS